MKNRTVKIFSSAEEISDHSAEFLKSNFLGRSGNNYTIALSGGSTPKNLFKFITANYRKDIKWNGLKFFFGDERCVPPDDSDSNFKMAKENLFEPVKIKSENIFRIKGESNPVEAAKRYSKLIKKNVLVKNDIPQFDLIMLGLGEDGHTASIFPNQINIFHSDKFCETAVHPDSGQQRITLTGKVINNAKLIVFFVTGSKKAKIVSELLSNIKINVNYPASLVNPLHGKLVWMLDKEAVELLSEKW